MGWGPTCTPRDGKPCGGPGRACKGEEPKMSLAHGREAAESSSAASCKKITGVELLHDSRRNWQSVAGDRTRDGSLSRACASSQFGQ